MDRLRERKEKGKVEQRNRNIWLAVIVIVVVLCCCVATVAAVAASVLVYRVEEVGTDLEIFDLGTSANAQVDQVFETTQTPYLDVSNFAGTITVRAGEGNAVSVVATKWASRSSALDRVTVSMTQDRDRIEVRTTKADNLGNAHVELEIVAPPGTELKLVTGAGTIDVRDISGSIDAQTGAGAVQVTGAAGPIRLGTGAGDIEYRGTPVGRCRFESGAGDIRLRFPADPDVRVDLDVGWGSIDVGYDVDGSVSAREVTGVIGNGSQATIDAHTGVGSISIMP